MTEDHKSEIAERPNHIPWPPLLILVTVLAAVGLGFFLPLPWPGLDDTAARVVGLGLGAVGLALVTWAAVALARHETTILPHKGASELVTTGPFTWLRNPIYLGDALIMFGAGEVTKNIWFIILVPVFAALVTWLAILPEERHLAAKFGKDYEDYKERTRRWI